MTLNRNVVGMSNYTFNEDFSCSLNPLQGTYNRSDVAIILNPRFTTGPLIDTQKHAFIVNTFHRALHAIECCKAGCKAVEEIALTSGRTSIVLI